MSIEEVREAANAALDWADSTPDQRVVTLAEAVLALADDVECHQLV